MSVTVKISSFDKLMEFIETYNLEPEQIRTLLACSVHLYLDDPVPPNDQLIPQLKTFWSKYGSTPEKPLFLY